MTPGDGPLVRSEQRAAHRQRGLDVVGDETDDLAVHEAGSHGAAGVDPPHQGRVLVAAAQHTEPDEANVPRSVRSRICLIRGGRTPGRLPAICACVNREQFPVERGFEAGPSRGVVRDEPLRACVCVELDRVGVGRGYFELVV